MEKICVVRLSALGDVVMMIPLIKMLRKNFPKSQITWIIEERFYPIVEKLEGIDFIRVNKINTLREFFKIRADLKKCSFDVLLATQASMSAHLFYLMLKAKRKIGYDAIRGKDLHSLFINEKIPFVKEHTVDGFLRFAKYLGVKEQTIDGKIPLDSQDYNLADNTIGTNTFYVMNPFSSKRERDWVLDRYVQVATQIHAQTNFILVLTGSKADWKKCEELKNKIPGSVMNMAGKTSLRQLAAILDRAKFVISPDTGPLHIASSMNTPVIGLYSASPSETTGPYFSREYTIDKHQLALTKFCKGKNLWNKRIYNDEVMKLITVDDVLEKVQLVI